MATRKSKKFFGKRKILIPIAVLLLLVGGIWAIRAHNSSPKSGTIPTISQGSNASAANSAASTEKSTPTNTSSPTSNGSTATAPTSAKNPSSAASSDDNMFTPSGTFVSNHKPSLGGTSAPSQEQSVCNTSPGAICFIQFVNKDGITKTLPTQTAGSGGSVVWNWDVKQAGFSQGSWQITAVASLNGQTKTAADALSMQVQP